MFKKEELEGKILFLMFAEIYLLPFWNVGPIPFKFSFIYIGACLMMGFKKSSFIYSFVGIICMLWIGKIISYNIYDETEFAKTIYVTLNYLLIIMGFLYAISIKKIDNLNWLFALSILYSMINLFVFIVGPSMPMLINFYSLTERLDEGLFLVRNPGIFTNPNVSALAANLILIFWTVARNLNLISYKKGLADILVFIMITISLISFQSRGAFLALGVTLLYYVSTEIRLKELLGTGLKISAITYLLLTLGSSIISEEINVFEQGLYKIVNMSNEIKHEIESNEGEDANRLYKVQAALENYAYSPIFGVGADRSTGSVLNRTNYHNDWSEILVSTGIIGFLLFFYVFYRVLILNIALAIPFIFGGMTNSFIVTVQIAMFYFVFIGLVLNIKKKNANKI